MPTDRGTLPRLIGMIHLQPLPGSPDYQGDLTTVLDRAAQDAATLAAAGFGGLIVENFGDAPFYADQVPPVTVAAMTRATDFIRRTVDLPLGINVLRNDAASALAVAAVAGAAFVRVNVLAGTMFTDQGPIVGKAAQIARLRAELGPQIAIMADVFVKHAVPPPGLTIDEAAKDLAGRGGADAIIASGTATGSPPTEAHLKEIRAAIGDRPLYVGSGADPSTAPGFLEHADGLIVGTATKPGRDVAQPVDLALATAVVESAGG